MCDEGMVVHDTSASIQGLGGPMTRSRTKKVKEALTQLVAKVLVQTYTRKHGG
ncbi:hypothetical protein MTR_1g083710 [Medicago truncatula]|uniref:Uncharacterized protein n=1 Tax=Medicago truncatula TaxID=3880 RepID=G7I9E7_MEDTR|nr:hypothetical protein MTR_1g083710 [Medicago truncatula]